MNSLGFLIIIAIISLAFIVSVVPDFFPPVENEDTLLQQAENHKNQAQIYEKQARELTKNGQYKEAIKKFALSAEEYHEAAVNYGKMHDFLNAAKFHGRSSLAYEEAHLIQSESHDFFAP
ncbi:hypothetical protein AAA799E16_00728 [Marine Group I thaumarchaeote SCGC AAA799-E16]|uniref:Uncharacterized protein n=4 Tax=Marine Group I TaxID=905826 RepID=A0A087S9B3_9ARCH|nr:hypothetical protein AAA799E16_00728 [Marine Group I thaumarchaeote SCGC AAA799-E16]KFM16456.1 hypothetical protein AAA799D11_00669 [Marine Group I thaumarchaeote SCGC AAA799-D11]KFM18422.1 hypothetical protein SCCGRSA3_01108 [Marine Group I thaumarchaeote SCGC RSA3]KFM22317.1 hypothetical protein AAA799B03_00067 [Marine Group I thaumarchaeote SCGC AAA799-B03]